MMRFVRNLTLAAAVAATAFTAAIPAAEAQSRNNNRRMDPQTERLVGIGFLGLAAGVAIGAIAAESNARTERDPRPRPVQKRDRYYDDHRGGYDDRRGGYRYHNERGRGDAPRRNVRERAGQYDAWTPGWARWCQNRYRSFNVRTGTYTTYGGEQRFCVVQ